jgi:uncharacterized protein YaiI (UPF0178 family)
VDPRFTIWVDADALPNEIKEIILRASERRQIPTVFVANKRVTVGYAPLVSFVLVTEGADVADAHIVESSSPGDLCITADVPLAARLVAKGVTAIDPRGDLYDESTIGERLATRDLLATLRGSGLEAGGPPPYSPKAKQKFAALFDSLVTRALRRT